MKLSSVIFPLFFILSLGFYWSIFDKEDLDSKPNVLFLFADDMTYSAINALGNHEIHTPNLDRMVREGTTFTHAFNMGGWNGAICLASRAMIISGQSLWNVREHQNKWQDENSRDLEETWGKLMESQGYDTYMSGKWHVKAPPEKIFQNVKHVRPGMPRDAWSGANMRDRFARIGTKGPDSTLITYNDIMPIGYNRPLSEDQDNWSPSDTSHGGFWQGGKHWSEVLKDDALSFLDMAEKEADPFFMYLAFNAPHDPRQAPQEFLDLYDIDSISLPSSWRPEHPYKEKIGNGVDLRDEALAPFPRTPYATKVHILEYYAIISHLDAQIGKILDRLESTGKIDNTYVFFSADHGLSVGKHGLIGKQSLYDHSIRVPLVVMGPDIPKNRRIKQEVYLQDIMPSTLEIAGKEIPEFVDFKSFLQQAKTGSNTKSYDEIYGAYMNLQRMIRKDGFKLIVYPKAESILLFDLENDPEEIDNLAEQSEYKALKEKLFKQLMTLQVQMGDTLDITNLLKIDK